MSGRGPRRSMTRSNCSTAASEVSCAPMSGDYHMARLNHVKTMAIDSSSARFSKALATIQDRIAALDYISKGSIAARMKPCGRSNCRCAADPSAWHGPYYVWIRTENGRFVQTTLTKDVAERMSAAIANYRTLEGLISTWIAESRRDLLEDLST